MGVAIATPALHVNAAAEAPRPLWYTRRVPAASRVPQAATTTSAVVKAVPAIPLSASNVNTCSAHRETYSVKTAQGRSALRTTLPFALAIVGFLIVWASFVSWKVASLVLILYSPLKDATPLTTWPIATALPTIALPRPTATHMPVAAGAPAYVAVSLVIVPDFENVTSSPPTVWHVAAPAPKKGVTHNWLISGQGAAPSPAGQVASAPSAIAASTSPRSLVIPNRDFKMVVAAAIWAGSKGARRKIQASQRPRRHGRRRHLRCEQTFNTSKAMPGLGKALKTEGNAVAARTN